MGVNVVLGFIVLSALAGIAVAIQCFQCGQYNDGVGSITPCINETHMMLKECPSKKHEYCIKYVSVGSTVRDCVDNCVEKDQWGQSIFCCQENGCNTSIQIFAAAQSLSTLLVVSTFLLVL